MADLRSLRLSLIAISVTTNCSTWQAASSRGPATRWRPQSSGKPRESGRFSARRVENFEETAGRGVAATIEGQAFRIGNPLALGELGIDTRQAEEAIAGFESDGRTVVLFSRDGTLAGLIAISDEGRSGAVEALQRLSRAGVRTVMLTGDNERSAQAIAHRVGIDELPGTSPAD